MKSNNIIRIAEEWIGTPFHQQGRQKQVGCDCVGLILGIAKEIGTTSLTKKLWDKCDIYTYNALTDSQLLLDLIPKYFNESKTSPKPGDILLIQITESQYHLSIQSNNNRIIHACSSLGRVISHKIIPTWKIIKTFQFNY